MGYAVIMFGVMLAMSVVIITAVNYGIAKDSQIAPLKAENVYAARETGKAQTALKINRTCIEPESGSQSYKRYTHAEGTETSNSGPYILYLTVGNNGSTVLKPNNLTLLYNTSYKRFNVTTWRETGMYWSSPYWRDICGDWNINSWNTFGVWPPLTYICMRVSQIYIDTPSSPAPGPELRVLANAENGVSTIAPTSPSNFTAVKSSNRINFSWNASYDSDGIAYYRLYALDTSGRGDCDGDYYSSVITIIPANTVLPYRHDCSIYNCKDYYFYLKAVDTLQNEGIQSRTIYCYNDAYNGACTW